ncbi:MAG TPA: dephospho-CoA kinase [Candidatus Polarisedimenticolia bacterium]|nr:dephospho-CoA kinase [Candidatus Polarisedimenticolia bacterium]
MSASDDRRLLRVGLTGGIACGRTTVGGIFARLGACVIDMDLIAHQLTAPGGAAVEEVAAAFGDPVRSRGGIDRKALGAIIFSDAAARARLESILHPRITAESERLVRDFAASKARGIAIVDAALLVETGGWRRYDRLVVVACDPELQLRRLMARDNLDQAEAQARIAAQAPLAEKKLVADYVLDTSGTLAETEALAHEVYSMLVDDLDRLPDLPDRRSR